MATDTAIRMAIAITLYHDDWTIHVIDIEAAFLEGKLKNPMYIEWLPGMVELGAITQEDADKFVCRDQILYSPLVNEILLERF